MKYGLKIYISQVEVRKVPIYVGGYWGSFAEKFAFSDPLCMKLLNKSSIFTFKLHFHCLTVVMGNHSINQLLYYRFQSTKSTLLCIALKHCVFVKIKKCKSTYRVGKLTCLGIDISSFAYETFSFFRVLIQDGVHQGCVLCLNTIFIFND